MRLVRLIAGILVSLLLLTASSATAKPKTPAQLPDSFVIGRHTFWDFGPPFDYYEIISVRRSDTGAEVHRLLLTPGDGSCSGAAKIETRSATIGDSFTTLLSGRNPCDIPAKDLNRELKRRKKGLVFSGAEITMQVRCGGADRLIRADVLDRDMFDPNPKTPENTSWTMQLLAHLDKALGPGVWDKPVFQTGEGAPAPASLNETIARDLSSGSYDTLYPGAPHKPAQLYATSTRSEQPPSVKLIESVPVLPVESLLPQYPPLARAAHIEGSVTADVKVGANGEATAVEIQRGHPMLKGAVEDALSKWRFKPESIGQQVKVTIAFELHCTPQT